MLVSKKSVELKANHVIDCEIGVSICVGKWAELHPFLLTITLSQHHYRYTPSIDCRSLVFLLDLKYLGL